MEHRPPFEAERKAASDEGPEVPRPRPVYRAGTALAPPPGRRGLRPPAQALVDRLLAGQVLEAAALDDFLAGRDGRLGEYFTGERLGQALVEAGLLTPYQLKRALAG